MLDMLDIPDELPPEPVLAARWLRKFHAHLMASHPVVKRTGLSDPRIVGWTPPEPRSTSNPYAGTASPPSTFLPDPGWHAATPQTTSDLVSVCLELDDALIAEAATSSDPSAVKRTADRAGSRADVLRDALSSLSAEIPLSSRTWLTRLRAVVQDAPLTAPPERSSVPLRTR